MTDNFENMDFKFDEDSLSSVEDGLENDGVFFNSHVLDDNEKKEENAEKDEDLIVGEYDDTDIDDMELIPSQSQVNTEVEAFPLSKELKHLVEERIAKLNQLENLEKRRQEWRDKTDLEPGITAVLNVQSAEFKVLPELNEVRKRWGVFQQKVSSVKEQQEKLKQKAVIEGKETVDLIITDDLIKAWTLAQDQYKLFFERAELLPKIFAATKEYLNKEPLYNMLVASGYSAEKLFSYAIYALALEECSRSLRELRKVKMVEVKELTAKKKRFFKKTSKQEIEKLNDLQKKCDAFSDSVQLITKEIKSFEKILVEEFWKCYEVCACLLVSKKVKEKREPVVRVFLRYGLLGHAPWFISSDVAKLLLKDCIANVKRKFVPLQGNDLILYADEYLEHVVKNYITGSINEELELTGRHTPEWYADKAVRRICFSRGRARVLMEVRSELIAKIKTLKEKQKEEEVRLGKMLKTSPNYKKMRTELAQSIQKCKVESARYERIILRIDEQELPGIKEKANIANEKLKTSGVKLGAFVTARKEAAAIHRVCRLGAKLKDPFLPFVLRDSYNINSDVINSRDKMTEIMQYVEHGDKHIFDEILINANKENLRIYMRVPPVILITPGCGFIGYSWNPRNGVESGKLVVPGYCPRSNIRERMIYNMLADFRWDTSKAEAGIDLLTSDTLVAAYSACRWNYRKKKKINREKALIFNEMNDRTNWRRHYELFLMSVDDSGRKLYYKNYEVYEMMMKYIGLPDGMERLRR